MAKHLLVRFVSIFLSFSMLFSSSGTGYASVLPYMSEPGRMLAAGEGFNLPHAVGIKFNPQNPLSFSFIVDRGDLALDAKVLRAEGEKIARYFFAALTIPEEDLWVNLSPDESGRIVPDKLSMTDLGRDMLGTDYVLKQMAASLTYPESETGRKYWGELNGVGAQRAVPMNLGVARYAPTNALAKVWITPGKIELYEEDGRVYLARADLKVSAQDNAVSLNQTILPALEKEVNASRHFANLRQLYYSVVLASWFKAKLRQSFLKDYFNQSKIKGVDTSDIKLREKIYAQYLESFKQGAYNYTKTIGAQRAVPAKAITRRTYFCGGEKLDPRKVIREGTHQGVPNNAEDGRATIDIQAQPVESAAEVPLTVSVAAERIQLYLNSFAKLYRIAPYAQMPEEGLAAALETIEEGTAGGASAEVIAHELSTGYVHDILGADVQDADEAAMLALVKDFRARMEFNANNITGHLSPLAPLIAEFKKEFERILADSVSFRAQMPPEILMGVGVKQCILALALSGSLELGEQVLSGIAREGDEPAPRRYTDFLLRMQARIHEIMPGLAVEEKEAAATPKSIQIFTAFAELRRKMLENETITDNLESAVESVAFLLLSHRDQEALVELLKACTQLNAASGRMLLAHIREILFVPSLRGGNDNISCGTLKKSDHEFLTGAMRQRYVQYKKFLNTESEWLDGRQVIDAVTGLDLTGGLTNIELEAFGRIVRRDVKIPDDTEILFTTSEDFLELYHGLDSDAYAAGHFSNKNGKRRIHISPKFLAVRGRNFKERVNLARAVAEHEVSHLEGKGHLLLPGFLQRALDAAHEEDAKRLRRVADGESWRAIMDEEKGMLRARGYRFMALRGLEALALSLTGDLMLALYPGMDHDDPSNRGLELQIGFIAQDIIYSLLINDSSDEVMAVMPGYIAEAIQSQKLSPTKVDAGQIGLLSERYLRYLRDAVQGADGPATGLMPLIDEFTKECETKMPQGYRLLLMTIIKQGIINMAEGGPGDGVDEMIEGLAWFMRQTSPVFSDETLAISRQGLRGMAERWRARIIRKDMITRDRGVDVISSGPYDIIALTRDHLPPKPDSDITFQVRRVQAVIDRKIGSKAVMFADNADSVEDISFHIYQYLTARQYDNVLEYLSRQIISSGYAREAARILLKEICEKLDMDVLNFTPFKSESAIAYGTMTDGGEVDLRPAMEQEYALMRSKLVAMGLRRQIDNSYLSEDEVITAVAVLRKNGSLAAEELRAILRDVRAMDTDGHFKDIAILFTPAADGSVLYRARAREQTYAAGHFSMRDGKRVHIPALFLSYFSTHDQRVAAVMEILKHERGHMNGKGHDDPELRIPAWMQRVIDDADKNDSLKARSKAGQIGSRVFDPGREMAIARAANDIDFAAIFLRKMANISKERLEREDVVIDMEMILSLRRFCQALILNDQYNNKDIFIAAGQKQLEKISDQEDRKAMEALLSVLQGVPIYDSDGIKYAEYFLAFTGFDNVDNAAAKGLCALAEGVHSDAVLFHGEAARKIISLSKRLYTFPRDMAQKTFDQKVLLDVMAWLMQQPDFSSAVYKGVDAIRRSFDPYAPERRKMDVQTALAKLYYVKTLHLSEKDQDLDPEELVKDADQDVPQTGLYGYVEGACPWAVVKNIAQAGPDGMPMPQELEKRLQELAFRLDEDGAAIFFIFGFNGQEMISDLAQELEDICGGGGRSFFVALAKNALKKIVGREDEDAICNDIARQIKEKIKIAVLPATIASFIHGYERLRDIYIQAYEPLAKELAQRWQILIDPDTGNAQVYDPWLLQKSMGIVAMLGNLDVEAALGHINDDIAPRFAKHFGKAIGLNMVMPTEHMLAALVSRAKQVQVDINTRLAAGDDFNDVLTENPAEAVNLIREFIFKYHSTEQVRDTLETTVNAVVQKIARGEYRNAFRLLETLAPTSTQEEIRDVVRDTARCLGIDAPESLGITNSHLHAIACGDMSEAGHKQLRKDMESVYDKMGQYLNKPLKSWLSEEEVIRAAAGLGMTGGLSVKDLSELLEVLRHEQREGRIAKEARFYFTPTRDGKSELYHAIEPDKRYGGTKITHAAGHFSLRDGGRIHFSPTFLAKLPTRAARREAIKELGKHENGHLSHLDHDHFAMEISDVLQGYLDDADDRDWGEGINGGVEFKGLTPQFGRTKTFSLTSKGGIQGMTFKITGVKLPR